MFQSWPLPFDRVPGYDPFFRRFVAHQVHELPWFLEAEVRRAHLRSGAPHRRRALADALESWYRATGLPVPATLDALARGAPVVVGGQQPAWKGGVAYSLYKALTILFAARNLEKEASTTVVPVFWMATEDADLTEMTAVRFPGEKPPPGTEDRVPAFLVELEGQPFVDSFLEEFGPLAARWNLVLLPAHLPPLRALAREIYRRALDHAELLSALLREGAEQMRGLRAKPPIHKPAGHAGFFVLQEGRREAVFLEGNDARIGERRLHRRRLEEAIRRFPEALASGVVLRPLVQDYLLETSAFVVGPTESAYLYQMRGLYARLRIPFPLLIPRLGVTLLTGRYARWRRRWQLRPEDIFSDEGALLARAMAGSREMEVLEQWEQVQTQSQSLWRDLVERLSGAFPDLAGPWSERVRSFHRESWKLRERALRALRRREPQVREQVRAFREWVLPDGKPQERVYAWKYLWSGREDALLAWLEKQGWHALTQHWVLETS